MSRFLATSPRPVYEETWLGWLERSLAGRSTKNIFSENLRIALARRGDAKKLAEDLGVSQATVSRWRDGESEPSFDDIDRLSALLGKRPYQWFMDYPAQQKQEIPETPSLEKQVVYLQSTLKMLNRQLETLKESIRKSEGDG